MNQVLNLAFEIVILLLLLGILYFLASLVIITLNRHEENELDERPTSLSEVEAAVKMYGKNANSIYHLYGTIRHFRPKLQKIFSEVPPVVAYVSLVDCNIMVMDPLCDPRDTKEILLDFARNSVENSKKCLLFPITEQTAQFAKELGFGVLQVGKEPGFDLRQYSPENHSSKIMSPVKRLLKQGWSVDVVSGNELESYNLKSQLYKITEEWLALRQSESLGFISEVLPFNCCQEKIYFVARLGNQVDAFLACSPIPGRRGWYFHDLVRRSAAASGLSETLTITALSKLKERGADFASLGIVPLAGLDALGVNSSYPWTNRFLNFVFRNYQSFVKFKDLYHFKKKFDPSIEQPVLVAFYPPKLSLRYFTAVSELFSPKGILGEFWHKAKLWSEGNLLPRPLLNLLSPEVVTLARPVPFTFYEFLNRMKFTLLLFFLNIYTYLNTTSYGRPITFEQIYKYGFSFESFLDHKWFVLVTSNFLHFNFLHLFGNMTMLLIFGGVLEFISGTFLVTVIFLLCMNANVPTGFIILPLLKHINVALWHTTMTYLDVGASLGIVGILGALLQFLRHKRLLLTALVIITMTIAAIQKQSFGLDHTVALIMGYILSHFYLHFRSQRTFFINTSAA
jgi:membrane associated rhomboid family serine protease